jgi:hypothetical protein
MSSSKFINQEIQMCQSVWIIKAWQHISPELTMKGFKKCWISNAVDGTDDDMLWNDSEEDGNVRSECEEDEGTDCEDGASDTDW